MLDVSDPTHPVTLGQWNGSLSDITCVYNGIAVAASGESHPYLLDISDPTNVHQIGDFTGSVGCDALGVVDGYLCMMGYPGGVNVYDISDPTQPQLVATCDTAFIARLGTLAGNYAYIAGREDGLHIINLTNPLQPSLITICGGPSWDVTVTGSHAIVSSEVNDSLSIWNVADPTHPSLEGSLVLQNSTVRLTSNGNIVCAAPCAPYWFNTHVCLDIIDISNPAAPAVIGVFGRQGQLRRFAIGGTTGYLADAWGLRTIALGDPNHISELANMIGHPYGVLDVAVRGFYAYVADGYSGLYVFNVSNPASPESLTCVNSAPWCNGLQIVITGDYAYVFDQNSQAGASYLNTYSLSNPEVPECVNSLSLSMQLLGDFGVTVSNGCLYFVDGFYDFTVFSLVSPASPQVVGSCPVPHILGAWAHSIAVTDDFAYVADNLGGIRIIDLQGPMEVGWINGYYQAVATSENTLIAKETSELQVMDLTDPVNPTVVGYYPTNEWLTDMEIAGSYLYTTSVSLFRMYHVDALTGIVTPGGITPNEFALYPCYPNPFNSTLVIPFTIPIQTEATIIIYNILGQKVREFTFHPQSPGMHRVIWSSGECASGLYFIQLITGEKEFKQKVVLLK